MLLKCILQPRNETTILLVDTLAIIPELGSYSTDTAFLNPDTDFRDLSLVSFCYKVLH